MSTIYYKPNTKFKMGTCITQDNSRKQLIKSKWIIQRWLRDKVTKALTKYRETTRLSGHLDLKRHGEASVTRPQGSKICGKYYLIDTLTVLTYFK